MDQNVAVAKSIALARRCLSTLCFFLAALLSGCGGPQEASDVYPRRPIKLIIPFAAGGGSDTFGRVLQHAMDQHQFLSQPLVIINVPGAGGTIGSRRVKNARPDGYTLLLLHEGILTAQHAGSASYGPEAFVPIAGTGNATQVIAVSSDSPYDSLTSLMQAAKAHPDTIVFSANIGAPSHFAGLMLEAQEPGAEFRYTQSGGGAKRFAALHGGHVDVSAFSIAEYVQFRQSGLRALGLLAPERHPELPELATAREQGFDVISQNMQFWWAPLGTDAGRVAVLADAIEAAMETDEVKKKLSAMKISDVVYRGDALQRQIEERSQRVAAVAPSTNVRLPNFTAIGLFWLACSGILAAVQATRRRAKSRQSSTDEKRSAAGTRVGQVTCVAVGFMIVGYVAALQWGMVSFVPATAGFAICCGGLLAAPLIRQRQLPLARAVITLLIMSSVMSVAIHQIFTELLVVDLP